MASPAPPHLSGVLDHHQVADGERLIGASGLGQAGPADQTAQPGRDLLHAERFGHVVVTAGADPGDAVLDRVARGEEQHADRRIERPQPAQHLEAVDVGQADVEHHRVRPELARPGGRRRGR